jgi:hypothetical protein
VFAVDDVTQSKETYGKISNGIRDEDVFFFGFSGKHGRQSTYEDYFEIKI